MQVHKNLLPLILALLLFPFTSSLSANPPETEILLEKFGSNSFHLLPETASREFTWWFPDSPDELILPISAGIRIDTSRNDLMNWLRQGSPWELLELPVIGLRYGDEMLIVLLPWPHFSELIVTERIGIHFSTASNPSLTIPPEIVLARRPADPLEPARLFREWRQSSANIGAIPPRRSLTAKIATLDSAKLLPGAPHFYLWGPALFSRHDVLPRKWQPLARALLESAPDSFGSKIRNRFSPDEIAHLTELSISEWPNLFLTRSVAGAIDSALRDISTSPDSTPKTDENRQKFAADFGNFLHPIETWGDGPSISLLNELAKAGIDRALLLFSDLYQHSPRPDLAEKAKELGFLLGPYDSYHSVHSPQTTLENSWETARFDSAAYENGRILNRDGTGNSGFKGRGFHFSPEAAWPYVQNRINSIRQTVPHSAWFIDCDATAESFDDFNPLHPATKLDDLHFRRQRLSWIENEKQMIVGSEGGSVLFADLIHFGHGVHTPYIGHLAPVFRDPENKYFLGRYWPPDRPDHAFKQIPVPPSLQTPWFDPEIRIPLYQAALGDELIATHHWIFDSLKFEDRSGHRELLEILYLVPPLYHLNRATWPQRKERILRHFAFFSPLHRKLATAQLSRFDYLDSDRLLQQTTFLSNGETFRIVVNFSSETRAGFPPKSATAFGFEQNPIIYQP